jgi:hypothetical protein
MDKTEEPKTFYCDVCKKSFANVSALNKHFKTASHLQNESKKESDEKIEDVKSKKGKTKLESMFYCPLCQYETDRKDYFTKHIDSIRHQENYDKYEEGIEGNDDYDKLSNLLIELSKGKIKIGTVKVDGMYKEITPDEVDEMFRLEYNEKLKKTNYPKNIEHTKSEGKTKEQIKKEKKEAKIDELQTMIKEQTKEIEKYNKQQEKYIKSEDIKDLTYNKRRIDLVKEALKINLEKLEKLIK